MAKTRTKEPSPEQYNNAVTAFKAHGKELRRSQLMGDEALQFVIYPWAGEYLTLGTFKEVLEKLTLLTTDLFSQTTPQAQGDDT